MKRNNINTTILCRCGKQSHAKGMCITCYCRKYRKEHPETTKKAHINQSHKQTCDVLKKHAIELKDDPERLTTKFMQALIGRECKETTEPHQKKYIVREPNIVQPNIEL